MIFSWLNVFKGPVVAFIFVYILDLVDIDVQVCLNWLKVVDVVVWTFDKCSSDARSMLAQIIDVIASFLNHKNLWTYLKKAIRHVSIH